MESERAAREGLAGACGLLLIGVVILLVAKGLYPADLPESRHPDFVDNVFDNRGVLWAARLLLVSAAGVLAVGGIFIVLSIGVRVKNREWLRRAGPFEISEGPAHLSEGEAEFWHRNALASREEADALRESLRQSEELLGRIRSGE
jgi:hypothetical protein